MHQLCSSLTPHDLVKTLAHMLFNMQDH